MAFVHISPFSAPSKLNSTHKGNYLGTPTFLKEVLVNKKLYKCVCSFWPYGEKQLSLRIFTLLFSFENLTEIRNVCLFKKTTGSLKTINIITWLTVLLQTGKLTTNQRLGNSESIYVRIIRHFLFDIN